MRTLFFLLLLANLSLFGYIKLDNVSSGEGIRLEQQIQPEKIRVLTRQQVAALGPDKTAALPDVCAEWGPFGDADRQRAMAELEPFALGRLLTFKRVEAGAGYWVFVAPFATSASAERRAAELRAAGVQDISVVETGAQRFAISLGVFRTEDAANAHAADLVRRGVTNARAAARQQSTLTALVVRDPPAPVVARLKELQAAYPGAELRIGSCDKGT
jgi:hypothetical protein